MRGWPWRIVVIVVLIAVGAGVWMVVARGGTKAAPVDEAHLWTCPMHPSVIRTEPGQCPICGMDLVPVEETKTGVKSDVAGHGVVVIEPDKQQLIGVVTTRVERRPMGQTVRTVGRVVVDEQLVSHVHSKVDGWVETLYADQTGKIVRKGEPLLTIYSPELVSTQEEYLLALRSRARTKDSPFEEVRRSGDSMVSAARERLRLWDVSEAAVARLETTGEVRKALTLYAPSGGYVMVKEVVEGMRVMPEMTLYELADLSRVWVDADVYEYEAPLVKEGMEASLTIAAQPGKTLRGKVTYVYPTVAKETRTLTARLEFENPGLALKPGMYGDVAIESPGTEALAIPDQAVLDSGVRKVVFVKVDESTFVPREVRVGARASGYYPVLSGLEEGEQVVSSPNFLIDSESRFSAALEQMKATGEHAGHGQ